MSMTEDERLKARAEAFRVANPDALHNPYDISTWGNHAGVGFQTFKDAGGTHITTGARKARGMASDGVK